MLRKNVKEKIWGRKHISIGRNKIKKAETFYKNSTVATSNQQRYLFDLLGGELNYRL